MLESRRQTVLLQHNISNTETQLKLNKSIHQSISQSFNQSIKNL